LEDAQLELEHTEEIVDVQVTSPLPLIATTSA
jgi:hypothetical protein